MVDRGAAVPLYHQIFLQLRDEILSGQRPYHSAMPTEQELSELFGVSRITARRVLGELAQQHFVERKRRLGTRVVFRSPGKPIEANIDQAVDSLLALGQGTTVNVIEVTMESASRTVSELLKIKDGEQVVRAVRVRCLDGEPIGHVVSFVPASLEKVITRNTLVKAPILRLLHDAGREAKHAEQTIGATLADTNLAETLDIEPRSALLRIVRTVYDHGNTPFLLTFAHYRADRFNIRLDLQDPAAAT